VKGPPQGFWGKLKQAEDGSVTAWHPLADHCADVAACCEALLRETILARRLAALAGRDRLSPVQLARLCVLAALHDIGKFNRGFQNKAQAAAQPKAGHLAEVVGLFGGGYTATQNLLDALRSETLATWGIALEPLLVATISHHGRPIGTGRSVNPACWEVAEGRDPFAGIADLVARTAVWFPEAWTDAEDPLPEAPAFQHAWCGLVTLADWIGSDEERYFPFSEDAATDHMPAARQQTALACERLGLTAGSARRSLGLEPPGFSRIAPGLPALRPAQAALLALMPVEGSGSVALRDNRKLVEAATHPDLLKQLARDRGEPSQSVGSALTRIMWLGAAFLHPWTPPAKSKNRVQGSPPRGDGRAASLGAPPSGWAGNARWFLDN
jgi:CRISPR-associated endonuclease/helicase Cas3